MVLYLIFFFFSFSLFFFLPEASLLASLILCTVCALCCLLQPTVCLRAVWVLALSHWRGAEEPREVGTAVMILAARDNER